jgi:predicted ribosome-associated RNA-binding protein Tma20
MKILNEKGIQCEHSKSTEVLVDMGWVCVCANGFQFSRINADQIFSLREYIERQDVVFIEAPRWPKRLSPKEFLERLS